MGNVEEIKSDIEKNINQAIVIGQKNALNSMKTEIKWNEEFYCSENISKKVLTDWIDKNLEEMKNE